jgi:hypothetical protein
VRPRGSNRIDVVSLAQMEKQQNMRRIYLVGCALALLGGCGGSDNSADTGTLGTETGTTPQAKPDGGPDALVDAPGMVRLDADGVDGAADAGQVVVLDSGRDTTASSIEAPRVDAIDAGRAIDLGAPVADGGAIATLDGGTIATLDGGAGSVGACTGPGPTNPKKVSGFPGTAVATLTTGTWSGWGVSHGTLHEETDPTQPNPVLHTTPPGDAQTSYFVVPANLLGDLSQAAGVRFKLRTTATGGSYYDSNYKYYGDVVLRGGGGTTTSYATVSHMPNGDWHEYFVEFTLNNACWSVGADTLASVLSNVTGLAIRAEFTTGTDETWLADFGFVRKVELSDSHWSM